MIDPTGLVILIVLIILFGFLTLRAVRARRTWVKWVGGIPAGLLTLALVALTGAVGLGFSRLNTTYANPVRDVSVAGTPEQLRRGEQLARTCAGCHSPTGDLPLAGTDFLAGGGPPVGTLWAANLTPTHLAGWSDGEIIRAIREGVGKDGHSLLIMPSKLYRSMSDEDVQAVVAYLRSQPAVEPDSQPRKLNVGAGLLLGISDPASLLSAQAPLTEPVVAPPAGETPEYGLYMSIVAGCVECHGATLEGVQVANPNGPPAGPSLVAFAKRHTIDEFIKTMRTGLRPEGTPLSEDMPWRDFALLPDGDLRAIYVYATSMAE